MENTSTDTLTEEHGEEQPPSAQNSDKNIESSSSVKVTQENGISLRQSINRRPVARMERTRHKRQTLQDMARPLKRWLYRHRSNPYPSKTDKFHLASDSSMTLTQVSNWFANARRRLKNTVRETDVSWERRIVLYNSCVEGNQERLSVNSDDSYQDLVSTDHAPEHAHMDTSAALCVSQDSPLTTDTSLTQSCESPSLVDEPSPHQPASNSTPLLSSCSSVTIETVAKDSCPDALSSFESDDTVVCDEMRDSAPHKYKQSMLQRYLTDSCLSLQMSPPSRLRHQSGSLSSHDYEEITSSKGSPFTDLQYEERLNNYEEVSRNWTRIESRAEDDIYWKEISAALALTTLSRSGKQQQNVILSTQPDPVNTT